MRRSFRKNFPQQPAQREVSDFTSSSPELDVNNPLREKLTELGINVPKGLSAATFRQLYNENVKNNNVTIERKNPSVTFPLCWAEMTSQTQAMS